MRQQTGAPLPLFYSYAHEDEPLREQLENHLRMLRRQELVSEWYDRQIVAGTEWSQEIDAHLETASVILLLISPDFLASDYCYEIEMQRALERHAHGEAHVIPIILRPCEWHEAPFAHIQVLPRDGKPVTEWVNLDAAFLDITKGIRRAIAQLSRSAYPVPIPSATDRQSQLRLIKQVHRTWIEGLLEPSLHEAARIELHLEDRPDVLANPWRFQVQELAQIPHTLPAGTSIVQIYDESDGELLILGAPGGGKTTLLLELARTLLDRAEQDEQLPLPVVFHLSSWAEKRMPLKEWLMEELHTKYQVPRQLSRSWIKADRVLPLLDGLDEVVESAQAACVQAINVFYEERLSKGNSPLVLCCRSQEYHNLTTQILVQRAVSIIPLSDEQIDAYLTQAGESIAGLRQAIQHDADLHEMVQSPLLLAILTLAYAEAMPTEILTEATQVLTLRTVFTRYIERMLTRRSVSQHFSHQQFRDGLTFLAKGMQQQHQSVFYLEYLQPNWLGNRYRRLLYRVSIFFVAELFVGLVLGVVAGLLATLNFGPEVGFRGGLLGFVCGLFVALIGMIFLVFGQVRLREALLLSWERMKESISIGSTAGILNGLVAALCFGLTDGGLAALFFGLTFGLINGLIAALIAALSLNRRDDHESHASNRDQRIWNFVLDGLFIGMINGVFVILLVALATASLPGQSVRLPDILVGMMFDGLAATLLSGLIATFVFRLNQIHLRETLLQSWVRAKRSIVVGLVAMLLVGLVIVLLGAFAGNVLGGLLAALPFGLLSGSVVALVVALSTNQLDDHIRSTPNQGIWRSARNGLIASIPIGLAFGLLGGLIIESASTPTLGLYAALLAGLIAVLMIATPFFGLGAFLQHFTLRFWLWRTTSFPWKLVAFLDEAVERLLLRKAGRGYIFIHRLLLEYFASLEKEDL